jgi:hypothetical protein
MPILIGLGLILAIYFYVKFAKFRSAVNYVAKNAPKALQDAAEQQKNRKR